MRLNKGSPIFYIDVVNRHETDWLYWCNIEKLVVCAVYIVVYVS